MPKKIDLTGQTFGRLTVTSEATVPTKGRGIFWLAVCSCGGQSTPIQGYMLTSGKTQSCGCLRRERMSALGVSQSAANITHGASVHRDVKREYVAWRSMVHRCTTEKGQTYRDYKARGIAFAPEWADYANFFADMGACPAGLTLERLDNSKGYGPDNCVWATRKDQSRNRRNNILIEHDGNTQPLSAWAEHFDVNYKRLHSQITRNGTDLATALARLQELDSPRNLK